MQKTKAIIPGRIVWCRAVTLARPGKAMVIVGDSEIPEIFTGDDRVRADLVRSEVKKRGNE